MHKKTIERANDCYWDYRPNAIPLLVFTSEGMAFLMEEVYGAMDNNEV